MVLLWFYPREIGKIHAHRHFECACPLECYPGLAAPAITAHPERPSSPAEEFPRRTPLARNEEPREGLMAPLSCVGRPVAACRSSGATSAPIAIRAVLGDLLNAVMAVGLSVSEVGGETEPLGGAQ